MSIGSPVRLGAPQNTRSWTNARGITTQEWSLATYTAGQTGASDFVDTRGFKFVTFEFIAAAGGTSATVAINGAIAANADSIPATTDFLQVNATDETSTTAATATVNAGAKKILSVPVVHGAITYWQVNVSANTLSGSMTVRVVAEL